MFLNIAYSGIITTGFMLKKEKRLLFTYSTGGNERIMKNPFKGITFLLVFIAITLLLTSCQGQSRFTGETSARSPEKGQTATTTETAYETDEKTTNRGENEIMDLEVTSSAFSEGQTIPKKYTADGEDVSPPLSWSSPPEQAKSIVVICDDPDAPVGTWDHWVLFNLPPDKTSLNENVPAQGTVFGGAKHGKNSWGNTSYGGPSPPPGKLHRYIFKVYAVDKVLDLPVGADKNAVLQAMEGHVVAKGKLIGKYGR